MKRCLEVLSGQPWVHPGPGVSAWVGGEHALVLGPWVARSAVCLLKAPLQPLCCGAAGM